MYRPLVPPTQRKGIILLVVLAMLTLFTIVGISFVLYADAAATQARIAKDANVNFRPEMEPEEGLSLFLDQFIFGVRDDETGVYSGLRGHELVRNMYGFNYQWADTLYGNTVPPSLIVQTGNDTPFSGIGRLHYPYQGPAALPDPNNNNQQVDDWKLINYTYYNSYYNNGTLTSDGFLRDPERYGFRTGLRTPGAADNRGPYLASTNVPYTYPDLNNFYLAAVNSNGNVLAQSFHRGWLFGPLYDPNNPLNPQNNPNWNNAVGKYLTLRPRPNENPNFPYPSDPGGDVKNLIGYPGGNDSIWIDIGAPVRTTPDGRTYKMLVAPLIIDLDGRINLNVAGNIAGQDVNLNPLHLSKDGLGPWEIDLGPNTSAVTNGVAQGVLPATANGQPEWQKVFLGQAASPRQIARYGPNGVPLAPSLPIPSAPANNLAPTLVTATGTYYNGFHFYSQFDYRGQAQAPPTMPTLPSTSTGPRSAFPNYAPSYHNSDNTDLQDHPVLYNPFSPFPPNPANTSYYNRRFRTSNLERFFRWGVSSTSAAQTGISSGDTGIEMLTSELERLLPMNFNNPASAGFTSFQHRNRFTLHSGDRLQPGISPYVFTPTAPTAVTTTAAATQAPQWTTAPGFPTLPPSANPPSGSDFTQYWQSAIVSSSATSGQALWRLDLNNPFANIPASVASTVLAGRTATTSYLTPYPNVTTATTVDQQRFDQDAYVVQFQQAQFDRQWLARQIYLRLLAAVGLPANAGNSPSAPDLQVRRWYGQLAVNMVDYIDNDDISTAFNFYSPLDVPGLNVGLQTTTTSADGATNPAYWVFGTELPRIVLNEALIEYTPAPANPAPTPGTTNFPNNVWVELFNPLDNSTANTSVGNKNVTAVDQAPVPLAMQQLSSVPTGKNGAIPSNTNPYAVYQVVIADQILPLTTNNDNVLGLPNTTRAATAITAANATTAGEFGPNMVQTLSNTNTISPVSATVSATVSPQGYLVLGPPQFQLTPGGFQDFHSTMGVKTGTFTSGLLQANTQILPTGNMQYTSTYNTATTFMPNDSANGGQTIMLRRLANPHIPYNPNITWTPQGTTPVVNPWYNPYVTVDYIQSVPLNNTSGTATTWTSYGKNQPYASLNITGANSGISPVTKQQLNPPVNNLAKTKHTFGQPNNPLPGNNTLPNAWLTHLDRQLTSPLELLHVSQYQPYQLTQQFMLQDPWVAVASPGLPQTGYMHAPLSTWYNQNTRLYRLFELLQTNYQQFGSTDPFRSTGKLNLNSIWDLETFMALCDPQNGNTFSASDVQTVWNQLIALRSPNYNATTNQGVVGPTNIPLSQVNQVVANLSSPTATLTITSPDAPFLGLAPGVTGTSTQYPQQQGIANTIFAPGIPNITPGTQLFDYAVTTNDNPYTQTELLRKIFNNTTSRSNAFAVWLTVGFFEVTNTTTRPVQLGAEMNNIEGRRIRHRMFAIIDRSGLQLNPYPSLPAPTGSLPSSLPIKTPFLPSSPPAWTRSTGSPPTNVTTNLTGVVPYWAVIE